MFLRLCVRAPRITIASLEETKLVDVFELDAISVDEFKGKTPE